MGSASPLLLAKMTRLLELRFRCRGVLLNARKRSSSEAEYRSSISLLEKWQMLRTLLVAESWCGPQAGAKPGR